MCIPILSFLLLAMSLPALAHHDWREREYRHGWNHRRAMVEECGPRYLRERPLAPAWAYRPRVVLRESGEWCEPEREVVFLPPPPRVVVRPRLRVWIGF